jgi:hypothetical protein
LTVNTTLRQVDLFDNAVFHNSRSTKATLSAHSYEAFTVMLRVRTSLILKVPPSEAAGADATLRNHFNQMLIEQRLNKAGRGRLLASSQTTKEEWVDALHEMSSDDTDDDPDPLRISCIFSLFRLNPEVVSMS